MQVLGVVGKICGVSDPAGVLAAVEGEMMADDRVTLNCLQKNSAHRAPHTGYSRYRVISHVTVSPVDAALDLICYRLSWDYDR